MNNLKLNEWSTLIIIIWVLSSIVAVLTSAWVMVAALLATIAIGVGWATSTGNWKKFIDALNP